jgi:predicted aconitase
VTTASTVKSDAARLGYLQEIERAGGIVLQGVLLLHPAEPESDAGQ